MPDLVTEDAVRSSESSTSVNNQGHITELCITPDKTIACFDILSSVHRLCVPLLKKGAEPLHYFSIDCFHT